MSRIVSPGSVSTGRSSTVSQPRPFFATDLVRRYGLRAVLALCVAALLAFAPLGWLYWFAELRLQPVSIVTSDQKVSVSDGRFQDEQAGEEPGETALLQVICEVPTVDGWRELLRDDDPARDRDDLSDRFYVRHELVYLRRAGDWEAPFAQLGRPPVSVWLPAGEYDVLVVHDAPRSESRIDAQPHSFPLVSVSAACALESRQKFVCRVRLPHYDWSLPDPILVKNADGSREDRLPTSDELEPYLRSYEHAAAVPTPAGYVLSLPEPQIDHAEDHGGCTTDLRTDVGCPREWSRDQLVSLRNWLPQEAAAARKHLSGLIDRLEWRQFLEGWFCYGAAAVAGLVFTRWGAISLLEPWRRRQAWSESLRLAVAIALFFVAVWVVFESLANFAASRRLFS